MKTLEESENTYDIHETVWNVYALQGGKKRGNRTKEEQKHSTANDSSTTTTIETNAN